MPRLSPSHTDSPTNQHPFKYDGMTVLVAAARGDFTPKELKAKNPPSPKRIMEDLGIRPNMNHQETVDCLKLHLHVYSETLMAAVEAETERVRGTIMQVLYNTQNGQSGSIEFDEEYVWKTAAQNVRLTIIAALRLLGESVEA